MRLGLFLLFGLFAFAQSRPLIAIGGIVHETNTFNPKKTGVADFGAGVGGADGVLRGEELIKQAANKMNDVAGDGTTTVTVLTYHILNEANKLIAAGHNPMQLRKGLEAAASDVLAKLKGMSEDIKSNKKRVAEVATISAGDAEIG